MRITTGDSKGGSPYLFHYFKEKVYTVSMSDTKIIQGRLVAIHWPAQEAEATLEVTLNDCQIVTAEIEDAAGVTHRVEVNATWEADSFIGKLVQTNCCDDQTTLCVTE